MPPKCRLLPDAWPSTSVHYDRRHPRFVEFASAVSLRVDKDQQLIQFRNARLGRVIFQETKHTMDCSSRCAWTARNAADRASEMIDETGLNPILRMSDVRA